MSAVAAFAAALVLGQSQGNPNTVTWRTYKEGSYSRATDLRILVMETPGDFQRYMNAYAPEGAGDAGDVDWAKEELIAIHIGTRDTGGYSVYVSTIAKVKPGEAQVSWAEKTPGRGLAVTEAKTSPWVIVRLNRLGARLTFAGRKEEGRLPGGIRIIDMGLGYGCTCCDACIRSHQDELPWSIYDSGPDCPDTIPSRIVINNADEYAAYRRNFKMDGLDENAGVDWSRDRLIAIHLGRKLAPGYRVAVDAVKVIGANHVNVKYFQVQPTWPSYGPASPYTILRVPRLGAVVSFTEKFVQDTQSLPVSSCDCGCASCRYSRR